MRHLIFQISLAYEWHSLGFEEAEEHVRPEYIATNATLEFNPVNHKYEPYMPKGNDNFEFFFLGLCRQPRILLHTFHGNNRWINVLRLVPNYLKPKIIGFSFIFSFNYWFLTCSWSQKLSKSAKKTFRIIGILGWNNHVWNCNIVILNWAISRCYLVFSFLSFCCKERRQRKS